MTPSSALSFPVVGLDEHRLVCAFHSPSDLESIHEYALAYDRLLGMEIYDAAGLHGFIASIEDHGPPKRPFGGLFQPPVYHQVDIKVHKVGAVDIEEVKARLVAHYYRRLPPYGFPPPDDEELDYTDPELAKRREETVKGCNSIQGLVEALDLAPPTG